MSYLRQQQLTKINNIIDNLNIKHDLSFPENSILEVAEKLGISVKTVIFKENVAGLLDYGTENEGAQIFISETDSEKKRNFTIAHEIGHLLLHKTSGVRLKVDRHDMQDFAQKSVDEEEADYFAAELLVPQIKLKEIIFKARMTEWDLIDYCSAYFNVSKSVIANRLKWLKF